MTAHILLVEDDENLRMMIAHTLRRGGYEVTQAANGEQALELLAQAVSQRLRYDIVLTDIVMDEINGIEVMQTARSQPDPPQVILITGHGSLQTAMEAVRQNAFDYILKPCPRDDLLQRVAACVAYRRNQEQPRTDDLSASSTAASPPTGQNIPTPGTTQDTPAPRPMKPFMQQDEQERYRTVGLIQIDTHRHEVRFDNQLIRVTPTEYAILACLAASPGQVMGYSTIVRCIRDYQTDDLEAHDLLRAHIRNLRRKVDRRYIVSVYAVGYMLVDPEEERNGQHVPAADSTMFDD